MLLQSFWPNISWLKFLKSQYIISLGSILGNIVLKTNQTNLWQSNGPEIFDLDFCIEKATRSDSQYEINATWLPATCSFLIKRFQSILIQKYIKRFLSFSNVKIFHYWGFLIRKYTSKALPKLSKSCWSDSEGGWYNPPSNNLHFWKVISTNALISSGTLC